MSIIGNALGIDPNLLKKEIRQFQATQLETNTLLKEQNQLLTQILIQLGGKPTDQLESF
jgi:hypothetical protein